MEKAESVRARTKRLIEEAKDPGKALENAIRGMNAAENIQNQKCPEWLPAAGRMFELIPLETFSTEDVRIWAYSMGLPKPFKEKAWGGVARKAAFDGLISDTFTTKLSGLPETHKDVLRVWKKKLTGKEYMGKGPLYKGNLKVKAAA